MQSDACEANASSGSGVEALHVAGLRLRFQGEAEAQAVTTNEWRSAFGMVLRERSCLTNASVCHGCQRVYDCRYSYLFDTVAAASVRWAESSVKAPHPMVLRYHCETTTLDVLLFGRSEHEHAL